MISSLQQKIPIHEEKIQAISNKYFVPRREEYEVLFLGNFAKFWSFSALERTRGAKGGGEEEAQGSPRFNTKLSEDIFSIHSAL